MESFTEIEPHRASSDAPEVWKLRDSVINGRQAAPAPKKTLDELIAEICEGAKKGDEDLLARAKLVVELRERVEAGEAGNGLKWHQWAREKFGKKATWLNELHAIGNAKDPKAALAHYRLNNCERQKRYNERRSERASDTSEWTDVIKLIRSMDAKYVPTVHAYLRGLISA